MPGRPPFLLLVDDDDPVIDSLAFAFELEGFRVIACADAESALDADIPQGPGCMVIDLNLPGMDGLELLAALRARGATAPVVLITTHPTAKVRERARAQGALIVEKPLITDALLDAVRGLAGV
jgi:two-component system response regulator FixJ